MKLDELYDKLSKLDDTTLVTMKYNQIYPVTNFTMWDYSYISKDQKILVGICFKDKELYPFTVKNLMREIKNLANGDSGISWHAKIFIESSEYKCVPIEVTKIELNKIKIHGELTSIVTLCKKLMEKLNEYLSN